jgi:uncharacterized membrane protein
MNQLLIAMILSVLPVFELRGGLPLAIDYALKNNIPLLSIYLLIVFLNVMVIFFIFLFLDFLHDSFMEISIYKKAFGFFIKKIRKKADKVEEKMPSYGYLALTFFVAIPLPVTGAWTGCLVAWFLGLDRKKSILAIALGVVMAGLVILLASLGVFGLARP